VNNKRSAPRGAKRGEGWGGEDESHVTSTRQGGLVYVGLESRRDAYQCVYSHMYVKLMHILYPKFIRLRIDVSSTRTLWRIVVEEAFTSSES
jgi:hypothetical protein